MRRVPALLPRLRACSSLSTQLPPTVVPAATRSRDLVAPRTRRRSVRDIVKYGMRTSDEDRAYVDGRRTSEVLAELTRTQYNVPRLKLLLGWVEENRPTGLAAAEHTQLLLAYERCRLGQQAAAHLERMRSNGGAPEAAHCNLAIVACARFGGDGGAERAEALLRTSRAAGVALDAPTYNAVIAACARGTQPELGWRLLARMRADGLFLDEESYVGGLVACVRGGQPARALALVDEMTSGGLAAAPLLELYEAAVAEAAHAAQPHSALARLADARAAGVVPRGVAYGPALGACAAADLAAEALRLKFEMEAAGLVVGREERDALVRVFARAALAAGATGGTAGSGRQGQAVALLDEMVAAGMRPSGEAYQLTLAAGGDGAPAEADRLYVQSVRSSAVALWASRCQADLRGHNRASVRAAVRCALRDYGRDLAAQQQQQHGHTHGGELGEASPLQHQSLEEEENEAGGDEYEYYDDDGESHEDDGDDASDARAGRLHGGGGHGDGGGVGFGGGAPHALPQQSLVLFTGQSRERLRLKRVTKHLRRQTDEAEEALRRRHAQLLSHITAAAAGDATASSPAPSASSAATPPRLLRLHRRAESIAATLEAVAALRSADGATSLGAALDAARALEPSRAPEEAALGSYAEADEAIGLAATRLETLQVAPADVPSEAVAAADLQSEVAGYLEELHIEYVRDRIGGNWLAVPPPAVRDWCARDATTTASGP